MAKRKTISRSADGLTSRTLVTEHIAGTKEHEHRVQVTQHMGPVMEHVRKTAQKVNEAPTVGNRHQTHYVGSVPVAILQDWLIKRGKTMDQYARNENGLADKFKSWFLNNRDLMMFRADAHTHRIKRVYSG